MLNFMSLDFKKKHDSLIQYIVFFDFNAWESMHVKPLVDVSGHFGSRLPGR